MKYLTRLSVLTSTLVFIAASFSLMIEDYREWQKYKEWHFIREVLLFPEFGDNGGRILRWSRSPRIVFASNRESDKATFNKIVLQLNNTLDGTGYSLSTKFDKDLQPQIFTFIGEPSRFYEVLELMNCGELTKFPGYFCTIPNDDRSLKTGIVVVSSETTAQEMPSLLLEEVFQVLGPMNDSDIYPDSLVFETGQSRTTGKTLSARDKKLLRFLYLHLKPGDGEEEVRRAFDKYWDKMNVK